MTGPTQSDQVDAIHARIFAGMVEGGHILVGELHAAGDGEIGGIIGSTFVPVPEFYVAEHPQLGMPVIVVPRPNKTAICLVVPLEKLRAFGAGLARLP